MIKIGSGAKIEVINDLTNQIFSSTKEGEVTVRQLMLDAHKQAADHGSAVNSRLSFGTRKASDKDNRVYAERGMVRRSLATYDPEASGIVVDPTTLAHRVLRAITAPAQSPDSSLKILPAAHGTGFEVINTLPNPVYINVVRLADGKPSISSIGQPTGTYILLPGQAISRSRADAFPEGEANVIVATYYDFDIDSLLEALEKLLEEAPEEEGPELDLPLFVAPVPTHL